AYVTVPLSGPRYIEELHIHVYSSTTEITLTSVSVDGWFPVWQDEALAATAQIQRLPGAVPNLSRKYGVLQLGQHVDQLRLIVQGNNMTIGASYQAAISLLPRRITTTGRTIAVWQQSVTTTASLLTPPFGAGGEAVYSTVRVKNLGPEVVQILYPANGQMPVPPGYVSMTYPMDVGEVLEMQQRPGDQWWLYAQTAQNTSNVAAMVLV
ncbi:MAG: hypothetical protein IRY96_10875, partial [Burkholderiales bacterium]|nr:hypothetical protein [Burkholderiales bacterium]